MSTLYLLSDNTREEGSHHAWTSRGWRIHLINEKELFDAAREASGSDILMVDACDHDLPTVLELLNAVRSRAAVVARNCDGCHRHSPWSILRLLLADEGISDAGLVELVHEWLAAQSAERTVSLASVLRVAGDLRLTMELLIVRGERREGLLHIVDGEAVAAVHGDESGLNAIREMETLQDAGFRMNALPDAAQMRTPLGWVHTAPATPEEDETSAEMLGAGAGRFATMYRVHRVQPDAVPESEGRMPTGQYDIVWNDDEVRAERKPTARRAAPRPAYDTDDFPAVVGLDSDESAPGEEMRDLSKQVHEAMQQESWDEVRDLLDLWESRAPQDAALATYREMLRMRRSAT